MLVEFPPHADQDLLADHRLQGVGGILHHPGHQYGSHIQGAVEVELVHHPQVDGDIDDFALHFQGVDPEKQTHANNQQKDHLQRPVAFLDPVK